jgi:hypothetical protein
MVTQSDCQIVNFLRRQEDQQDQQEQQEQQEQEPANNPVKTFEDSGNNDLCFEMNVVFWIYETFYKDPEFRIPIVYHTGSHPTCFKIVNNTTGVCFNLVLSRMKHIVTASKIKLNRFRIDKETSIYEDFWSVYGTFILQQCLGVDFVNYDYIGNQIYKDMFYNNYGLCNDLVAHILKKVVHRRYNICMKDMWIDIDEFANDREVTIHNVSDDTTDYDINLLIFKALITVHADDCIISQQIISQVEDNHYRVGDAYDDDLDGYFSAKDYIIKRNKNSVKVYIESKNVDRLGEPVWNKFIHDLC